MIFQFDSDRRDRFVLLVSVLSSRLKARARARARNSFRNTSFSLRDDRNKFISTPTIRLLNYRFIRWYARRERTGPPNNLGESEFFLVRSRLRLYS